MLALPLTRAGFNVIGLDLHSQSIDYGKQLFKREGFEEAKLRACDLSQANELYDVVIASEVLEHIDDSGLADILCVITTHLKLGGQLLITVPNGYGWFEIESYLWFKTGIGWFLERTRIAEAVRWTKSWLFGCSMEEPYPPSTLADSPHVQRFTYNSIQQVLAEQGFEVLSVTGSVLFAGPFSNLFFTGIAPVMKMNCWLGQLMPRWAAGFYVACRPIRRSGK
jgi:2-polyprenyl-3-methyl-5-hydroxy-6-metoxy-1,4-benzoquinol methylase